MGRIGGLNAHLNDDPVNDEIVRNAGNKIVKLMKAGEETFGSILSSVLQATDFLKGPALQKFLCSGYDPTTLSDDAMAPYIIIPGQIAKPRAVAAADRHDHVMGVDGKS